MADYHYPKLKPCVMCGGESEYGVRHNEKKGTDVLFIICLKCGHKVEGNVRRNKEFAYDFSQEDFRQIAKAWNYRGEGDPSEAQRELKVVPLEHEIDICTHCEEPDCPGYCYRVRSFKGEKYV